MQELCLLVANPFYAFFSRFNVLLTHLAFSMNCPNSKVIRAVHSLMSRLISSFPTEPFNSQVASKYEELEQLYASVGKVIYEGLTNYEKNPQVIIIQWFKI